MLLVLSKFVIGMMLQKLISVLLVLTGKIIIILLLYLRILGLLINTIIVAQQ